MRAIMKALASTLILISTSAVAEIPYVTNNGIEEVDYEKLNLIVGFKLPDSGQFRETTWVHGEDADYTRNPADYTISEDDKILIDNNTKLMWERQLNWRWEKVEKQKGPWRPQDVFGYKDGEPRRRPYHEGVQYCKSLRLGGFDDWRMPNIKEAHTIANYAALFCLSFYSGELLNNLFQFMPDYPVSNEVYFFFGEIYCSLDIHS